MVINPLDKDSQVRMYFTSRGVRTWRILVKVIACDFLAACATWRTTSHVVTGAWCSEVGICDDRVGILFVSSR